MQKSYFIILLIFLGCFNLKVQAQSVAVPLNKDYYHLIERYQVKSGFITSDFAQKPWQRKDVARLADLWLGSDSLGMHERDRFNMEFLALDNWEWSEKVDPMSEKPIWKHFYTRKADWYFYGDEDFQLHIRPVIHFGLGQENEVEQETFVNTRGVEARGQIAGSLGFYTYLGENQARFPVYGREFIEQEIFAVPGEGFWKDFKEGGVDFLTGRAYLSFDPLEALNIRFGYDRHFFGHGHRSLLLSDFSNNFLFLQFNTRIGKKIQFSNVFAELRATAFAGRSGSIDGEFPRKYMTLHRLGYDVLPNLNIGVFEQIIFGNDDVNNPPPLKIAYFNPLIFTRSLMATNAPHQNRALGLDARWNLFQTMSLYGMAYFDNFGLDKIGSGNWNQNLALQAGLKYFDVLDIPMLDVQLEYNHIPAFTYAAENYLLSMSHYRQPLAHPMGAGLREAIAILRYQPLPRLNLKAKAIYTQQGRNLGNQNVGQWPMDPTGTRVSDAGNGIGQGNASDLLLLQGTASYMIKHNLFLDVQMMLRELQEEQSSGRKLSTNHLELMVRWNIPHRDHDF